MNSCEPRSAICIGERDTLLHFLYVCYGMQGIGVNKFAAKFSSEQLAYSCLASARDTHYDDYLGGHDVLSTNDS